jgi:transposase
LPWEGIPVRIELCVRRLFCCVEQCGQQIFTERLQNTVKRYWRRTCRLSTALERITMALGWICWIAVRGAATGCHGQRLNTDPAVAPQGSDARGSCPRILGIDDWARRKGHRYGMILCDLERGKILDLLPERSSEARPSGFELILKQRLLAGTEPVCMLKRLKPPCRMPYKLRIVRMPRPQV